MTTQELIGQTEQRSAEVNALCNFWLTLFPDISLAAHQADVWLQLHSLERVVFAVRKTAAKRANLGGKMSGDYAIRFCSKVANDAKTRERMDSVKKAA